MKIIPNEYGYICNKASKCGDVAHCRHKKIHELEGDCKLLACSVYHFLNNPTIRDISCQIRKRGEIREIRKE